MSHFSLPYGDTTQEISIPDHFHTSWLAPLDVQAAPDPIQTVRAALEKPIGGFAIVNFRKARTVAIAINDKTRPVPNHILIPPLLDYLLAAGIKKEAIFFVIASGTHIPMEPAEFPGILPTEITDQYRVYAHDSDADDLVDLGVTGKGTPIRINRLFMQADLRIVVGNIEPHHFMGFSGGVKTASIGLAARSTINQNHAMLSHPLARTLHYADNPMRQDIEEIGAKIGIHLAVNAILNNDKEIVHVIAGAPVAVMNAGIPLARSSCLVQVDRPYDLVIASAGGYPKDINLYQAQKGLTHAAMMTRSGGIAILAAECREGIGSQGYEQFMEGLPSFEAVFDKFRQQGFRVGPHKAFQFARDASRMQVMLVSNIPEAKVKALLLTPHPSLQTAVDQSLEKLGSEARIAVLPIATITVPSLA